MKRATFDARPLLVAGTLVLLSACGNAAAKPAPPTRTDTVAVPATVTASPLPDVKRVAGTPAARSAGLLPPGPDTSPATTVPPTATPSATPAAADAPPDDTATPAARSPGCGEISRLVIPAIEVNAGFVTLGLLPNRQMDAPKTKDDVGCYVLDGYDGSNLVLGGHVDWYTHQPGVFWDLRKLVAGDEAQVMLRDGSLMRYRVTDVQVYQVNAAPIADIVADTPAPTLTLITCDGEFNSATGEYNKSRVVRAVKSE